MKARFQSRGIDIKLDKVETHITHAVFKKDRIELGITPVKDGKEVKLVFGYGVFNTDGTNHTYHTSAYMTIDEAVEKIWGRKPYYPEPIKYPEMEAHSICITYSVDEDDTDVIEVQIDGVALPMFWSYADGMDISIILSIPTNIGNMDNIRCLRYNGRGISLSLGDAFDEWETIGLWPGFPDNDYGHGNRPINETESNMTFLWYFEMPAWEE